MNCVPASEIKAEVILHNTCVNLSCQRGFNIVLSSAACFPRGFHRICGATIGYR
jgi:hypothetical protein